MPSKHLPSGVQVIPITVDLGGVDIPAIGWDDSIPRMYFGNIFSDMWLSVQAAGAFTFKVGSGQYAALNNIGFTLNRSLMQFDNGVASCLFTQVATPLAVTGEPLGLKAQSTDSVGGTAFISPGTGTVSGGESQMRNAAGTPRVRANDTGLGFFNTAPIARPDVTGSRATGAALVSLLAAGVALGLWTDSTSA